MPAWLDEPDDPLGFVSRAALDPAEFRSDCEVSLILSMTGFGEARLQDHRWTILVEVRSVNNRHFKLSAKISDGHAMVEPALEQLVRDRVRRGTVQVNLRIDRPRRPEDYRLNLAALTGYRDQLKKVPGFDERGFDLSHLLVLPGVVEEAHAGDQLSDQEWPEIAGVVAEALSRLEVSRAQEGRAMAAELVALARGIHDQVNLISQRGPEVVKNIQSRLCERVRVLLHGSGGTVEPAALAREVAILADRSDISEEIVRLRAHLAQFIAIIDEPESAGRKLEFVTQEMGREINTIGSKANDVEISRLVVEAKSLLEKVRELIQNAE
jgi:uncharacterized protein (TIGR00255 family)